MPTAFRTGMAAAEQAAKRKSFARATFFSLDDGESAILRFLTEEHSRCGHLIDAETKCRKPLYETPDGNACHDHGLETGEAINGWITVDMHASVKTRDEPEGYSGNWPKSMPAVCRYDQAFKGQFDECYIDDHMVNPRAKGKSKKYRAQGRTWALACVREEVREGGKITAVRDKMHTVTKVVDGKEVDVEEPLIMLVNFGWQNFFGRLKGTVLHYGTCLDRDYKVTRSGEELDTVYDFVAYDPIDEDIEYEDGTVEKARFDLREQYFEDFYPTDIVLEDEIERRASDEYYDLFFDERHEQPYTPPESKDGDSKRPKSDKKGRDADPDQMRALAARVQGYDDPDAEAGDTNTDDDTEAEAEVPKPATASRARPRKATAPAAAKTGAKASGNGAAPAKSPAKKAAAKRR